MSSWFVFERSKVCFSLFRLVYCNFYRCRDKQTSDLCFHYSLCSNIDFNWFSYVVFVWGFYKNMRALLMFGNLAEIFGVYRLRFCECHTLKWHSCKWWASCLSDHCFCDGASLKWCTHFMQGLLKQYMWSILLLI